MKKELGNNRFLKILKVLCFFACTQTQAVISTFDGVYIYIPFVKVGEDIYSNVSLELKEDSRFRVNDSDAVIMSSDPVGAEFDGNKLFIRTLTYQEVIYSNLTLEYEGELEFSLVSADTPLLTSSSSFANRNTDLWIDYVSVRDKVVTEKISEGYASCICEYYGVVYADFDLDGDDDLFVSTVWWGKGDLSDYMLKNYRSVPVEMYLNDGFERFVYTEDLFIDFPPLASNTRKAITADFNGDIFPDIFLAETGFDGSPFPGATPTIILSNNEGRYQAQEIDNKSHFMHGAAAGDIDSDGDSDIVAVSFDGILFFENNGLGEFKKSKISFFKSSSGVFNLEVFDFNNDSHPDIITTGHYWQRKTQVVFGPEFVEGMEIDNSEVTKGHVVNDIQFADLDGDGMNEIIQSTTGGEGSFYQGAYIEVIYFDENLKQTSNQIVYQDPDRNGPVDRSFPKWIPWLKIADINADGKLDILEDDKHDGTTLINKGDRNFSIRFEPR